MTENGTAPPETARPALTPTEARATELEVLDDLEHGLDALRTLIRARGGGPLKRLDGVVQRAFLLVGASLVSEVRHALEGGGPLLRTVAAEVRKAQQ